MRQNSVVGTLAAQSSVGELGGKSRVPMVKMVGTNRAGQHEICVRVVLRYRAENLKCDEARGIRRAGTLRGCGCRELTGRKLLTVALMSALITFGSTASAAFHAIMGALGAFVSALFAGLTVKSF